MAVIKIVPMPGAEGQQGETGAVGPQGPQGNTGATGPAGADAVWYYNGEYNPGASYVIGDVVTYDGQLWYRKNANGGNVGDTPSEGLFWDLLAAKGQDGPQGPQGNTGPAGADASTSLISSGTWDTNIKGQSQISGGVSLGLNNPGFGSYYCVGDLVTFEFRYNLSDSPIGGSSYSPITFNSSADSGFSFKLPFPIREPYQGGVASNGYHYAANEYLFSGTFFGRVDSNPLPGFNMPDEEGWININGVGFTDETDPNNRRSFVILDVPMDAESINTNVKTNRRITHQWPFDFSGTPAPYHHYFDIRITGTYIRA